MENLQRFDDYYFTICKETGGIEGVLHSMFNFLYRRTDFFYEADPGDKMGFLPGYSKNLLGNIFDQYQEQHYKRFPQKDPQQTALKLEEYKKQKEAQKTNTTTAKQISGSSNEVKADKASSSNTVTATKPANDQKNAQQQPQTQSSSTEQSKQQQVDTTVAASSEDSEVVIEPKKQEISSSISTYNGGVTDKYKWSQSISDITVEIPLPKKFKAKELDVEIKSNHLKVGIKGEKTKIIDGEFFEKVNSEDSIWNLDGQSLILTLEKGIETIWKTVIKGDVEIDATKVENSKPLDSFDSETQGALRKIMYEQQRKQMGLPTTEEENQMTALKAAWDAEGSPFKGQPFDPSKFNLQQGGMNLPPME